MLERGGRGCHKCAISTDRLRDWKSDKGGDSHIALLFSVDPAQFGAVGYRHRPVYFRTTAAAPGGRRSISTQTLESAIHKSKSVQEW